MSSLSLFMNAPRHKVVGKILAAPSVAVRTKRTIWDISSEKTLLSSCYLLYNVDHPGRVVVEDL